MKKNFVKKLAVALSLAMTVSALAPAANAEAAASPAFKSSSVTVNAGQTKKYSTANSKKYSVAFKIGNTNVATISYTKGSKSVKVTGVTAGSSTLRADFKSYSTKRTTTVRIPVTVRGINVAITGADNFVTAVNDKYALTGTLSGNTSAQVYWSVAEEGASIDATGVFTATKTGEYTVTATVRTSADGAALATATQVVTVKDVVLKGVSQTSGTELTAVVGGDSSKLTASDITIRRTTDNVVFPVSTVTVDSTDASRVTLTTFSAMTDGNGYTVTYGDTTLNFTATDGKVVSLVVDPVTVPYNTETELHVLGKDAQGINVFDATMTDKDNKLDITVETTQGYTNGDNLVLFERGNTARVTATLHTWEYDNSGAETGVITTTATVSAVDPSAVSLTNTKYTVAETLDWSKTSNTRVATNDNNYSLFFELKNSNGTDVTDKYTTIESSDTNTLLVSYTSAGKAQVLPVKAGTAYALVKDDDDNVVASFAITVVAEREETSLTLSPVRLTLSNSVAITGDSATTKLTLRDQYGDEMAAPGSVDITERSVPTTGNLNLTNGNYNNGVITVTTAAAATPTVAGTYVYDVKVGKLTRVLTVVVQTANNNVTSTYRVNLSDTSVDTTIGSSYNGDDVEVKVSLGEYKGNVKVANTAIKGYEVVDADGDDVTPAAIDVTSMASGELVITAAENNGGIITKHLEAGNYTARVTFTNAAGRDVTMSTGFVVTDNQPGVTYTVKKNRVSDAAIAAAVQNTDNIQFAYNGENISGGDVTYVTSRRSTGNTYAGIKVTVNVAVDTASSTTYTVPVTITLNQAITINQ